MLFLNVWRFVFEPRWKQSPSALESWKGWWRVAGWGGGVRFGRIWRLQVISSSRMVKVWPLERSKQPIKPISWDEYLIYLNNTLRWGMRGWGGVHPLTTYSMVYWTQSKQLFSTHSVHNLIEYSRHSFWNIIPKLILTNWIFPFFGRLEFTIV